MRAHLGAPASQGRLGKLEAIRGLAAVYVAVGHAIGAHTWWLKFGQEAVMVFFLLSGFVIEHTFARSPSASFTSFLLKRWV